MDNEEFKRAIDFYRSLALNETENEKIVDNVFIGPKNEFKDEKLGFNHITNPSRPFMSADAAGLDLKYVSAFRMGDFNTPEQLSSSGHGTRYIGGMEFGSNLVKQSIVKSIDDLVSFMAEYKLGIFDLYHEIEENGKKVMDIRIYECIGCAQLPNMGKTLCFFEAGLITGIFKELTNNEVITEELRCWGNGYSFCQFEVTLE
jgi:predicted hydrocarbon binding protein